MALKTLGTAATTTLSAMIFQSSGALANTSTLAAHILDDQVNGHPIVPGAWSRTGLLFIPNRGVLQALPGDYVAYDPATGWPILLSARAAAGASWVHT